MDELLKLLLDDEEDDKKNINIIAMTSEGFFLSINISTETYNINNIRII